jgi:hypothetical protein
MKVGVGDGTPESWWQCVLQFCNPTGQSTIFVSIDIEQLKTQTAVRANRCPTSRPTSKNALTRSGVVCEVDNGFSKRSGVIGGDGDVGLEQYGRTEHLPLSNQHQHHHHHHHRPSLYLFAGLPWDYQSQPTGYTANLCKSENVSISDIFQISPTVCCM